MVIQVVDDIVEMENHEKEMRKENNVVEPDEEFTPPAGKRKKTVKVEKSNAEA